MASSMSFSDFCNFCERISTSPRKEKSDILKKFMQDLRNAKIKDSNFDIHSVIRLLIPDVDRARGAYGIKEASLAKLYVKILCLPKESSDALRLTTFRAPKSSQSTVKDFADVAFNVLKRRFSSEDSTLTVEDINAKLDELADSEATRKASQAADLLQPLLIKLSPKEQKWLIRIILKDLKLAGLTQNSVLKAYHSGAKTMFESINNLRTVVEDLFDQSLQGGTMEIKLFNPFSPMLADRVPVQKIISKMDNKPFYVETKLDGERTQIHKEANRYQYYTRRGHDYTSSYGADPSSGNITPRLHSCFGPAVRNCILDGEMVAWNVKGGFIVSKGNIDVKNLSSNGRLATCFFAFDIVMLNDEVLTNLPLKERLKILEANLRTREGVLQFPSRKVVTTKAEVSDLLNEAIDNREEGIVLKNPDSIYKPNERKGGWIKVKPEYMNEMMDHLDLIILGGYYGHGRIRHLLSAFLMGLAVPSPDGQHPKEFFAFTRVGSGFSDEQLATLLQKLNPHWRKWDKSNPPPMILCGREKPDVWIEPSQSVILEIKASEVIESDSYKIGRTLRFPRVERIRDDRAWYSAMTLSELKDISKYSAGKLVSRHWKPGSADDEPASKRKKVAVAPSIPARFLPADVSNVARSSDCLNGKQLCVYNGDSSMSKHDIEKKVVAGGGSIVQHPVSETFCVIAAKDDVKVKSLKQRRQVNVVRPSWVSRCLEAGKLLPFRPEDLMVVTKPTQNEIEENYDQFGNSLFEETTVDQVQFILNRVKEQVNPPPLSCKDMGDIEYEYFDEIPRWGIFHPYVVYVDIWEEVSNPTTPVIYGELEIVSLDLRMHGAEVVQSMDDDRVTHVVCQPTTSDRLSYWKTLNRKRDKKFHLVSADWVTYSLSHGRLVDEQPFYPTLNSNDLK